MSANRREYPSLWAIVSGSLRWCLLIAIVAACRGPSYPVVPGDTTAEVSQVTIAPRTGEHLELDYGVLRDNLGLREKTAILPGRGWNPFRLAEDRRRVEAFLMENGRFEAAVDEPQLAWNREHTRVAVTWAVHEGPAYAIGSVQVLGAPTELADELRAIVTFKPGDRVDMPAYRPQPPSPCSACRRWPAWAPSNAWT